MRGTSTGCGHIRNQFWACWHSCPTSAGCEVVKKWSLARSSVYRMLLSATKGTHVKGKGHLLLPLSLSPNTHPYFQGPGWFLAWVGVGGLWPGLAFPLSHANHLLILAKGLLL